LLNIPMKNEMRIIQAAMSLDSHVAFHDAGAGESRPKEEEEVLEMLDSPMPYGDGADNDP
jgi:hypothetical protein